MWIATTWVPTNGTHEEHIPSRTYLWCPSTTTPTVWKTIHSLHDLEVEIIKVLRLCLAEISFPQHALVKANIFVCEYTRLEEEGGEKKRKKD